MSFSLSEKRPKSCRFRPLGVSRKGAVHAPAGSPQHLPQASMGSCCPAHNPRAAGTRAVPARAGIDLNDVISQINDPVAGNPRLGVEQPLELAIRCQCGVRDLNDEANVLRPRMAAHSTSRAGPRTMARSGSGSLSARVMDDWTRRTQSPARCTRSVVWVEDALDCGGICGILGTRQPSRSSTRSSSLRMPPRSFGDIARR